MSGTVGALSSHHVVDILRSGHAFALCTDDKGVFSTTLSHEYLLAADAFSLDCDALWRISEQAIEHSFASDETKQALRLHWKKSHAAMSHGLMCI